MPVKYHDDNTPLIFYNTHIFSFYFYILINLMSMTLLLKSTVCYRLAAARGRPGPREDGVVPGTGLGKGRALCLTAVETRGKAADEWTRMRTRTVGHHPCSLASLTFRPVQSTRRVSASKLPGGWISDLGPTMPSHHVVVVSEVHYWRQQQRVAIANWAGLLVGGLPTATSKPSRGTCRNTT